MQCFNIAAVLLILAKMLVLAEMRQQQRWKRLSIPPDYWQKLTSVQEEQAYGTFFDCASGCMMEEQCQAFIFDDVRQNCSMGAVEVKRERLIPDYLINGTEVFIRADLVDFKSVRGVPRFHHLAKESASYVHDASIEVENGDDFMDVDLPLPNIYDSHVMNLLPYKGGFLSCGGTPGGYTQELRCRFWTFTSKRWTLLDGWMPRGHWTGMHAILNNRLWSFCGRTDPTKLASRHVDSYDLIKHEWRTEPSASGSMVTKGAGTVPLERTGKILFVGGNEGVTTDYNRNRVVLFNAETKVYTTLSSPLPMVGSIACAMAPESDGELVLCAGSSHWSQARGIYYFDQVYFFEVLTEKFREYDAALKMPLECWANFVPFEDTLYLTTNNHYLDPEDRTVYEYRPEDAPNIWREVLHTRMRGITFIMAYRIDYHELLV